MVVVVCISHSKKSFVQIINDSWQILVKLDVFRQMQSAACNPDTTAAYQHLTSNLQQTKNETTNVVINIIIASS